MVTSTPVRSSAARIGLLQVALAGVLWGTGGLAVRIIRDAAPLSVLTISAWRMLIAAAVLAAALGVLGRLRESVQLVRARPVPVVAVGVSTAAYQALYFGAVVAVGVTVATVVSLGLAPVLVTLAESVQERRVPSAGDLLVLVAALVGLVLVSISAGTAGGGSHPLLGLLAALASGAAYALTTLLGRSLAQSTAPLTLTTATTTVGAIALAPAALVAGTGGGALGDPVVSGTLVYLGVLTMALAYALLYAGLRTTPGSAAVVATLLEPVTAAALAAAFLDERLGAVGVVGAGLILAAVAGLGRRPVLPPG